MTTHSPELQWLLIRNRSSFHIRRKAGKAVTFTTEPYNLTNKNSYKQCGMVSRKAVGVTAAADNKGVVLQTKRTKRLYNPAKMFVRHSLLRDRRRTYRSIRKFMGCTGYRPDLLEIAVRRASALLASQKPAKRLQMKKRRH